jgi:predicted nucleic acid-binding protein
MRGAKAFFDTNVLIYAFAKDDPRGEIAETLLAGGGVVGVQTLNEFVAVAVRKLAIPWEEVLDALSAIRTLCPSPLPVTIETHDAALRIATSHGYHIYDSLVIAAARKASCSTLYSEDMHDGQVIDGLTIRNPFREFAAVPAMSSKKRTHSKRSPAK